MNFFFFEFAFAAKLLQVTTASIIISTVAWCSNINNWGGAWVITDGDLLEVKYNTRVILLQSLWSRTHLL